MACAARARTGLVSCGGTAVETNSVNHAVAVEHMVRLVLCTDMSVDMCVDMCVDVNTHVCRHACIDHAVEHGTVCTVSARLTTSEKSAVR